MTISSRKSTVGSVKSSPERILRGSRSSFARSTAMDVADIAAQMGIIRVTTEWNELKAGLTGTKTSPVAY